MDVVCRAVSRRALWPVLLVSLATISILAGCTRYGFSRAASVGDDASGGGDGIGVTPPDSDAGAVGDAPRADAPWPAFSISPLRRFYRTSGTLAWLWQCSGEVTNFDRYELCVSTDVAFPASKTRCLTPTDDVSLADPACGGGDLWHPVTVYGLEPATLYYAQLQVYDKDGVRHDAPLARDTTLAQPADRVTLFEDALPSGVWLLELSRSDSKPRRGSHHLEHTATSSGWTNLHYGGVGPVSAPGLTQQRFDSGFLEMYIDAPEAVVVCVDLVGGGDVASFCQPRGFASVDGRTGYQRVQIPLSAFAWKDGSVLDAATFSKWTKLQIGASWSPGKVRIDDIAIYY